jgi:hypothetical protein
MFIILDGHLFLDQLCCEFCSFLQQVIQPQLTAQPGIHILTHFWTKLKKCLPDTVYCIQGLSETTGESSDIYSQ